MKTIIVRILALLLAAFFAYAAYRSRETQLLLGSLFFGLMVFLSIRNAGAIDGPYVWRALAAVSFLYFLTGLFGGEYSWRRHSVALNQDPQVFWLIFAASFLFGAGLLAYAQFEVKREK